MPRHEPIVAPVYPSIGFDEVGALLRSWGYAVKPLANWPHPGYQTLAEPRFTIELTSPFEPRQGEYGVICLWSRMKLQRSIIRDVLQDLRGRLMFAHLYADDRGRLVASMQVVVAGGVTEYYLRDQFWYWTQDLNRLQSAIRKRTADFRGLTLH